MASGHELHLEITGNFIHACREIMRAVGYSLPIEVYKKGLDFELRERHMDYEIDVEYPIEYREVEIGKHIIDVVLERKILIKLLSVPGEIPNNVIGEMLSARNITDYDVALILNFGNDKLQIRRLEKRRPREDNNTTTTNNTDTLGF